MSTAIRSRLSDALEAPAWVSELLSDDAPNPQPCGVPGVTLSARRRPGSCMLSARLHDARALAAGPLGDRAYATYHEIAKLLSLESASHPFRFWNHICEIHEPMGAGLDRYMAFNVGRFRAFEEWFGGEANFDRCVATASGVGCRGDDIVIHALASERPGIPISNPRQTQPFRYSRRYGPRPPCFARATALPVDDGFMLLIGGTASIRGEDSLHVGDLQGQFFETLENLRALIAHAGTTLGRTGTLEQITDLRVYVTDPTSAGQVEAMCRRAMPSARTIQILEADICRKELAVEIEGRAKL